MTPENGQLPRKISNVSSIIARHFIFCIFGVENPSSIANLRCFNKNDMFSNHHISCETAHEFATGLS